MFICSCFLFPSNFYYYYLFHKKFWVIRKQRVTQHTINTHHFQFSFFTQDNSNREFLMKILNRKPAKKAIDPLTIRKEKVIFGKYGNIRLKSLS